MAGPDATLLIDAALLAKLLQLPDRWRVSAIGVAEGRVLKIDVVFPDGPTDHEPISLLVRYKRVPDHTGGPALALDTIEPVGGGVEPAPRARRRWLA